MTTPHDPTGHSGRKIADRTAGRAGALITMTIWLGLLILFDAADFAPIPRAILVVAALAGGGIIGWRCATYLARKRHARHDGG